MAASTKADQPIVIFGGFLSADRIYFALRETLAALTRQHVSVVQTRSLDWLPSVSQVGWAVLLRKLDRAVRAAAQISPTGQVTLIGHSAGGVLARLYLSPRSFYGESFRGFQRVSHLITLGSPHHNRGGLDARRAHVAVDRSALSRRGFFAAGGLHGSGRPIAARRYARHAARAHGLSHLSQHFRSG